MNRLPTNYTEATTDPAARVNLTNEAVNDIGLGGGWRSLTGKLMNGWTATSFRIRRRGDIVELAISGLNGTAAEANTMLDSSVENLLGYLPASSGDAAIVSLLRSSAGATIALSVSNTKIDCARGSTATSDAAFQYRQAWFTTRATPAAHPGTAIA